MKLAVMGAGGMGAQIAQQAALHGIDVVLQDNDPEQLGKARESNAGHLGRKVEKGRLTERDAEIAIDRVRVTADLEEAARDADFVIEAVFEDVDVKQAIFAELDRIAARDAVLASNSSTISISTIADLTKRPTRSMNMHFFYPVLVMDLVDIVRGSRTFGQTV